MGMDAGVGKAEAGTVRAWGRGAAGPVDGARAGGNHAGKK
jgi:hypothetical protein